MADDLPPLVDLATAMKPRDPANPAVTYEANKPGMGTGMSLPPEADTLYGRVRKVEGTSGNPWQFYGGDTFTPGPEHPGDAALRKGPQGDTHAAGPGQWQPGTWNGLKPEFEKRFGRAPRFNSEDDQRAMVWLNAAKIYPGGEEKLKADIAAGKLDTAALAPQWAGFGGSDVPPVIQSGKWRVSDKAIAYEQGRSNTDVVWMSPDDYLAMTPKSEAGDKRKSLLRSLNAGDEIEAIPTLDAKVENGRVKIFDQDGRNRAEVAKQEGVDLIPVAIHGVSGEAPQWMEDMNGALRPFNFSQVARATPSAPSVLERFGTGLMDAVYGATQAAPRMGAPETSLFASPTEIAEEREGAAQAGAAADKFVADREKQIQADRAARGETGPDLLRVAGNVAATAPLAALPGPEAAVGAGMLGRAGIAAARGALGGAEGAAFAPVTSGNYGAEKAKQLAEGAGFGAGLGGAGSAIASGIGGAVNAAKRIVTPGTITQAASRLFGEDAKKITDNMIVYVKDRLAKTFERIEKSHDLDLAKDPNIVPELDAIKQEARVNLGDENIGGRAGPIVSAIDKFLSLADEAGTIPGKAAATLWHAGGAIDRLIKNSDPTIRHLAKSIKDVARDAFSRALPPDEAKVYSATRSAWRDMKIVEKSIPTGETQVRPRQFVQAVRRAFPNEKEMRTPPEVVKLARALGETYPMGEGGSMAAQVAARLARPAIGGTLGTMLGGPAGGVLGIAGELTLERLLRGTRIASPNAMRAFLPPPSVAPPNKGLEMLRALGQRAPTAAGLAVGSVAAAP